MTTVYFQMLHELKFLDEDNKKRLSQKHFLTAESQRRSE